MSLLLGIPGSGNCPPAPPIRGGRDSALDRPVSLPLLKPRFGRGREGSKEDWATTLTRSSWVQASNLWSGFGLSLIGQPLGLGWFCSMRLGSFFSMPTRRLGAAGLHHACRWPWDDHSGPFGSVSISSRDLL